MAQRCSNFCRSIFVTHITNNLHFRRSQQSRSNCSKLKLVLSLRQGLTNCHVKGEVPALSDLAQHCQSHYFSTTPRISVNGDSNCSSCPLGESKSPKLIYCNICNDLPYLIPVNFHITLSYFIYKLPLPCSKSLTLMMQDWNVSKVRCLSWHDTRRHTRIRICRERKTIKDWLFPHKSSFPQPLPCNLCDLILVIIM